MTFTQGTVADIIPQCQTGDCFHFWGRSELSEAIEDATGGGPSHVAMVRSAVGVKSAANVVTVESTQISKPKKFIGVVNLTLQTHIDEYSNPGPDQGGAIVYCPLRPSIRAKTNWVAWAAYADNHVGDPYSYGQMVLEAYDAFMADHHIPILGWLAKEFAAGNYHAEFCSQLWCMYGQFGRYLGLDRVPGLTAPINSLQAAIYGPGVQILGPPLDKDYGYNTVAA